MEKPNLSYVETMSRGDESFVKKIIGVIKDEFSGEVEEYNSNYNSENFKLAAENVHKLKHKISILGLEKSYAVANDHENSLKEGKGNLHEDFLSILQIIKDFLGTI
ncbi:Hpt domain-containing protein [Seonamhaeicola sp. ML3]|uniref:Hpt domain-containing protein n=1 Tax=Seonamhaeicola sp. ML3 TaxID=2937786 RepID=UPI00200CEDF9|nr:Hpt domain-containing protein [Seonamhaeicola sp. ML3]